MSRKKTKIIVYALLLIGAFLLLFLRPTFFNSLKFTIVKVTAGPTRIISFPFRELKKILFYHRTFDEYLRLKEKVMTLKGRLVGLDELLRENSRLARLLRFKRKVIFSSVAANIIGRDPSNWNDVIILDKGMEDGINVGLPVVNAYGIVGKIAEVEEDRSKVILLTDPSFSVIASNQRSREVGLVSGTLQGICRMRYLSPGADIQMGDQIITSKISSSFPEGLLVGEVVDIHSRENSPTVDCLIQPAVSLSQIEEVLIIQNL